LLAQAAGSGNFTPIDATAAGNLKVAIEEQDVDLTTSSWLRGQDAPVSTYTVGDISSSFVQSTFTVNGGGNTTTYIDGQANPVSTYIVGTVGTSAVYSTYPLAGAVQSTFVTGTVVTSAVQSTYTVGGGPVSTHIVSVPKGDAEVSSGVAVNVSTVSVVMMGALTNYENASTFVGQSSSQPLLTDSTGALVMRDYWSAAGANPSSSWITGDITTSSVWSTFAVGGGVVSTFIVDGEPVKKPLGTYSLTASTDAIMMAGMYTDYAGASTQVQIGSTMPLLADSTGALVVRDLNAQAAAANPNSSWSMGSPVGAVPVSTFIVNGAAGGTSHQDDTPFTLGTDSGTPAMGVYFSSAAGSIEHGSSAVFRMTSSRAMHVFAPYTVSTFSVNELSSSVVVSTWSAGQDTPVSTYVVGNDATNSTWVAGQDTPVSTYVVGDISSSFVQSTFATKDVQSTFVAGTVVTSAVQSTFATNAVNSTYPQPSGGGGLSVSYAIDLSTSAAITTGDQGILQVYNGPCQLHGVWFTNEQTSAVWLKFYDNGNPTVGTTPPTFTFGMPAVSTHTNIVSGFMPMSAYGIQFNTSCFVAATGTRATNTTVEPLTSSVAASFFYAT
jgi:hypothetical protein